MFDEALFYAVDEIFDNDESLGFVSKLGNEPHRFDGASQLLDEIVVVLAERYEQVGEIPMC